MTLSVVRLVAVLPSWKPCRIPSWAALWCSQRWPGWGRCGAIKVVAGVQPCLWMPGLCWASRRGTTLSGTLGVGMPGGHCGPICACCFAVLSVPQGGDWEGVYSGCCGWADCCLGWEGYPPGLAAGGC
jgi:hypothetical protein